MRTMRLFAVVLLFLSVTGCATTGQRTDAYYLETVKDLRLYQLYVDQYGNLLNPGDSRQKIRREEEAQYIKDILDNFSKQSETYEDRNKEDIQKGIKQPLSLTVFIHGGLNSFKSATERVQDVKDQMLKEGKYPLFISWNSAPISNYKDHLVYLRRGRLQRVLGPLSSPFILLEDALRSIARIPASTYEVIFGQNSAFDTQITKYDIEQREAKKVRSALRSGAGFTIHDDEDDNDGGLTPRDWLTVWNPVKLITAPFVDGLGTGAWDSMLRRTDLVLRRDVSSNGFRSAFEPTAANQFFNRFGEDFEQVNISLIGHSMGAIVANNIISRYPTMRFQNIVYMAAACRIKDIEYVVVPYLQRNDFAQFYNLSLHPYRDISENAAYDFLPRGSLLMWIDQTFGQPNSFADRTAGYWFNIIRAAESIFPNDGSLNQSAYGEKTSLQTRVHLTRFAIEVGPKKHGDFNEARFGYWRDSFWRGEVSEQME